MTCFNMRFGSLALVTIAAFGQVACTSMQANNYSQAIRVTSVRPGAQIVQDGKTLGVTPAIVNVRRKHHPQLVLFYPSENTTTSVVVPTSIRWSDSILGGLILGGAAPLAWAWDFSTGTVWDLESVEKVQVPGRPPILAEMRAKLVAVAPPLAKNARLSDEMGQRLSDYLSDRGELGLAKVLAYNDTYGVFEDFQYNFENNVIGESRFSLYADLGISHLAEAEVNEVNDSLVVNFKVTDVLRDQVTKTGSLVVPKSEVAAANPTLKETLRAAFTDLIPNTVLLDLAKQDGSISTDLDPYLTLKTKPFGGWMGDLSKLLGSLGMSNLRPPRSDPKFRFRFRFVPAVTLAFNELEVSAPTYFFPQTQFEMIRTSAGIGPEISMETRYGNFYLSMVPGFAYSRIKYTSPVAEGETARGSINVATGIGFYRYISNRFAFRLFARNVVEDSHLWDYALDHSQGVDFKVATVSSATAGISLAFYFPEARRKLR